MKTIIRNFTSIFRKFVTANLLNLLGLSLAFASFFVIMTQVNYDLSYNKSFTEHENLFRIRVNGLASDIMGVQLPRPMAERLAAASPHVTGYGLYNGTMFDNYVVGENEYTLFVDHGVKDFLSVFKPSVIAGNVEGLSQKNNIVLPRSEAMRLFGTTDIVGTTLKYKYRDDLFYNICAVVEDYPENNFMHGHCFMGEDYGEDDYMMWNCSPYVRVNDIANLPQVEQVMNSLLGDIWTEQYESDIAKEGKIQVALIPIGEEHFDKTLQATAPTKSSSYLLLCFSLLIVIIAAVNFMNFTLAETPMRIHSINTQKVLGSSTVRLQGSLLAEAVIISVIAFMVALAIVYLAHDFGLQELVTASILLQDHPQLIIFTLLLSIAVGALAGAYPAYYATSFPPALVLKGSYGLSPKGKKLRTILICLQFAASFVLVLVVGIMYLQSHFIYSSDYGYDKEQVMIIPATPATRELSVVNAQLGAIPGIEGATLSQFALNSSDNFQLRQTDSDDKKMTFTCMRVDWRFIDVMGIEITEGRSFRENDGDVYIFNESAKKQFPWLTIDQPIADGDYPVVGFCKDIKYSTFRTDDTQMPIAFLVPNPAGKEWVRGFWRNQLLIRIAKNMDKQEAKQKVLATINEIEKEYPIDEGNIRYIDDIMDYTYKQENLFTKQILLFSLLAILISIIGVFGLTMFESEYRRKEIGIRKVFGSSTAEILQMFNKRYLYILLGCFVLAAPIGYLLGKHWLEGFAVKTTISPLLFLVSFLLISLITMLTVTYQSWKNASENPVNSIKTE